MNQSHQLKGMFAIDIGYLKNECVVKMFDYVISIDKFVVEYKATLKERLAVTTPNRVKAWRARSAERELGCKLNAAMEIYEAVVRAEQSDDAIENMEEKYSDVIIRILEEKLESIPEEPRQREYRRSERFQRVIEKINSWKKKREFSKRQHNMMKNLESAEKSGNELLKQRVMKRLNKLRAKET